MLWLLRHAEARDGTPDDERPLTGRGTDQARAVGLALRRLGIRLEACLSSPKLRAVQTARLALLVLTRPAEVEAIAAGAGAADGGAGAVQELV